ncbi:sensor histidine kinase [Paenibacillus aceris]|uniref:Two-component system sensor histidine kinase YesM n=1 Tax=Paenibacillus aceris TaxID=869555 RepID=A0ABS4I981_9BACL|nr:histidine kinase [Paenibacillus aceris]MBP1966624.1 two-component system sensor histidine kinase YesM [Paenibacillus aceris]NHW38860.1 histidine kinase [Paenibacillus aceris]
MKASFLVFQDMPIRKKIQFINVIIILPSIVFLTITLYQMTLHQAEERALRSSEQKIGHITNTVNTLFNDIENFSKLSMINKTYQSVLMETTAENNELQQLDDIQSMYASLNSLVESNPYIDSVVIQSTDGSKIYYSDNMSNVTDSSVNVYPKEQLIAAKGTAVWIETFESSFLVNDQRKNLLAIGRRIININNGLLMGYIYINIDERKLSNIYSSDDLRSNIMIVNAEGRILTANDPEIVSQSTYDLFGRMIVDGNGSTIFNNGKMNILVSSKVMDKNGWRAVYAVPTKELMKDQWKITLFILGFGLAGLLLALILSIIFSKWITNPIMQLSRAMTAVGDGKLHTRTIVVSNDEVGRLAYKFNEMVSRIQDLMHTINHEEKQKRKLELRLSYSQIKPHFLYNTLEMIRSMALMKQAPDIGKVVKSLGDFYRMSLNRGQELIPVSQERKHLESYLYIQTIRYHRMHYRIDFDNRIEGCWIPNMLLQPLVENAVYHGLRDKLEGALCEITGGIEEMNGMKVLCFTVKDNGNGMSEDKLERIWKHEPSHHDLSSFGISNIQERVRLRYGQPFGITILSKPGEGVEVQLRIPLVFEKTELEERM